MIYNLQVPKPLISRVATIRRIEWSRYRGTAIPGKQTIGGELPQHLHHMMMYDSVGGVLENLPFFQGLSTSFIVMLCKFVQIYFYGEGDIVVYEVR